MKRGGGRKSFSHAKGGGGGINSFEVVLTRELEVLAIAMGGGGCKKFPPFKRGGGAQIVLPCLEEEAQKVSDPRFSHFVAPPPHN